MTHRLEDGPESFEFVDESQATKWTQDMSKIRKDASAITADNVEAWLQNVEVKAEHWGNDRIPLDIKWTRDMTKIRKDSSSITADNVIAWLQSVKVKAEHWGNDSIPLDIKEATETTENTWAGEGNYLTPIFRNSIPKLVNALCEFNHSCKTSTFRHVYVAKNGDRQAGEGILPNRMVGFKRNKLKSVEITYFQLDGTLYTVRTKSIRDGKEWKDWIVGLWGSLSHANQISNEGTKNSTYRVLLSALNDQVQKHGHPFFPQSVRAVIHELQDRFGEPRTPFQAPV